MITELGKYVIETYRSDNVADPKSLIPFEEAKENKKKEKEAKKNTKLIHKQIFQILKVI